MFFENHGYILEQIFIFVKALAIFYLLLKGVGCEVEL
jgi:hypothetical protein